MNYVSATKLVKLILGKMDLPRGYAIMSILGNVGGRHLRCTAESINEMNSVTKKNQNTH